MKGLGYLISTLSVLLLGAVAWPNPGEPRWKTLALIGGMAASILGMGFRYLSHRKEKAAIAFAMRSAKREMEQESQEQPARTTSKRVRAGANA